jgi:hypothetical protein
VRSILSKIKHAFIEHGAIFFILIVATCLRLWKFNEVPFTHDELSALLRTNFSNFEELIAKGVAVDGHPAFVQVLLYYWTKFVGYEEWLIKLPFVFCGLASVLLSYRIGKKWFNETVGLIVAAIIACSEYTVMYSLIARPYITGLFFSLLLLHFWGEIVFFKARHWKYFIAASLSAALCAYNHHFGMLGATLVAFVGFLLLPKSLFARYLVFCGLALLLYLPHLNILLEQLKIGGVESWLGKPDRTFLSSYFNYTLHFSWLTKSNLILIIAYGIFPLKNKSNPTIARILLSGILFFAVFLTGYFYSIYGAAVLQYSVLIVVFPLLLFFLFGWIKNCSKLINWLFIISITSSFSFTLIRDRQFYHIFYVPTFKQLVIDGNSALQSNPKTKLLLFTDESKTRFYKNEITIPKQVVFLTAENWSENCLATFIKSISHKFDQIYFGSTSQVPPSFYPIIQQFYPYSRSPRNYFNASSIVFTKNKNDSSREVLYSISNVSLKKGEEWGPGFSFELAKSTIEPTDFIDCYTEIVLPKKKARVELINALEVDHGLFYYNTRTTKQFEMNDSVVTMIQSLKLADIPINKLNKPSYIGYIWNVGKSSIKIRRFTVEKRKGNPIIYSLINPIKKK